MRGWGLLNQLLRSVIFPILQNDQNTGYQYTITFIFDRCHRTLAAETPVKHERDLKWLTCIFAESKFLVTEKLTKGVSVTPTLDPRHSTYLKDINFLTMVDTFCL